MNQELIMILLVILVHAASVCTQCFYYAVRSHSDYEGCFTDTTNRLFPYVWKNSGFGNMTIDFCILTCADLGFKYAGLQSRQWCHCGDDPYRNPIEFPKVSDSECNTVYRIKHRRSTISTKQYVTAHGGGGITTDSLRETVVTVHGGGGITTDSLRETVVSGTGLTTTANCAKECSVTPHCRVFSIALSTNQCFLFKEGKHCDTPNDDKNSTIHFLL